MIKENLPLAIFNYEFVFCFITFGRGSPYRDELSPYEFKISSKISGYYYSKLQFGHLDFMPYKYKVSNEHYNKMIPFRYRVFHL